MGIRGSDPRLHSQKSEYNFQLLQNFTNSLLLIRSLTDNVSSRLEHIDYVVCIMYCIITIKSAKEKEMLRKS